LISSFLQRAFGLNLLCMWNLTAAILRIETCKASTLRSIALLTLASATIFAINYRFPGSYLGHDGLLARELRSPVDSVYQWRLADDAPFKYRMLFAGTVLATWTIWRTDANDNASFKLIYRLLTFTCFTLAVLTFYLLLQTLGFNTMWSVGGAILYLLLPPMSMAFTYPVHTKEDLLGFVLLNTGLIAFLRRNDLLFFIVCVLGAFCRETLLILPFIYVFYSDSPIMRRIVIAAMPVLIFIGIRFVYGFQSYDILGMGFLRNVEFFFQSLAFLFMSFNVLWILFFFSRIKKYEMLTSSQKTMLDMSLVVFVLIFVTAFLGGRIMELRLIFLAAPWMIVSSLIVLRSRLESMLEIARRQSFRWVNLLSSGFMSIAYALIFRLRPQTVDMMKPVWWVVLFLSCHASLVLLWMFLYPPRERSKI
jgi:hypothetical protein